METAGNGIHISIIDGTVRTYNEKPTKDCDEQVGVNKSTGLSVTIDVEVRRPDANRSLEISVNRSPVTNILNVSPSSEKSTPPTDEKPKPVSRRSSVFKRRLTFGDLFAPVLDQPSEQSLDTKQIQCEDELHPQSSVQNVDDTRIPLKEYIEKLKAESQEWSSLRRQRKREYKQVLKLPPEIMTLENTADVLTEADKAFLADAPDYERIAKDLKHLIEGSVMGTRIVQKAKNQTLMVLKQIEQDLDDITQDIINHSSVV